MSSGKVQAAPTRLIARQLEYLEQRVPDRIELFRLKARQGSLNQPAIVDGAQLIDQCVRIFLQRTGRADANPEGFGGVDELCGERDHERRRMLGIEQGWAWTMSTGRVFPGSLPRRN